MREAKKSFSTDIWNKIQNVLRDNPSTRNFRLEEPDPDHIYLDSSDEEEPDMDDNVDEIDAEEGEEGEDRAVIRRIRRNQRLGADQEGADDEEYSDTDDSEDDFGNNRGDRVDQLFLPSLLGWNVCAELKLERWMKDELALREGQANDALESLRDGLAHKALIYRSALPKASTTIGRTRIWGNAKLVNIQVRLLYQGYS